MNIVRLSGYPLIQDSLNQPLANSISSKAIVTTQAEAMFEPKVGVS